MKELWPLEENKYKWVNIAYIKLPKGTALKSVVDGFMSDHGFPQCGGAVDGTHIPIVSPNECPADYYNRKGFHSVLMQGVVGPQGTIY